MIASSAYNDKVSEPIFNQRMVIANVRFIGSGLSHRGYPPNGHQSIQGGARTTFN